MLGVPHVPNMSNMERKLFPAVKFPVLKGLENLPEDKREFNTYFHEAGA